jgi:hypothetical protein
MMACAAVGAVLTPLCLLPIGSGGFWARPVTGEEPSPDDEAPLPSPAVTEPLLVPPSIDWKTFTFLSDQDNLKRRNLDSTVEIGGLGRVSKDPS